MQTKPLLYGLIGFFIGGLLVSTAASMTNKSNEQANNHVGEMSMNEMTNSLRNKTGDDYDKAFISHMITHHRSAVDMAELSADSQASGNKRSFRRDHLRSRKRD